MQTEAGKPLNRDVIKYIATLAMLLNHIAAVFLTPGTPVQQAFTYIGYFTAITMCWFLVEGYEYTRSKKKYALRLLLFAVISELPFCLAFDFICLNMLYTLFICFLIIYVMKEKQGSPWRRLMIGGLIMLTGCQTDWGVLAPLFTVLFVNAGTSRREQKKAWCFSVLCIGLFVFLDEIRTLSFWESLLHALCAMTGPAFAGICICQLYNGKRMQRGRTFSKWFFYLFYPAHLTALALIRCIFDAQERLPV